MTLMRGSAIDILRPGTKRSKKPGALSFSRMKVPKFKVSGSKKGRGHAGA